MILQMESWQKSRQHIWVYTNVQNSLKISGKNLIEYKKNFILQKKTSVYTIQSS